MNKLMKAQKSARHLHQELLSVVKNIKARSKHLKEHELTTIITNTLEVKIATGYKNIESILVQLQTLGCNVTVNRKTLTVSKYTAPTSVKSKKSSNASDINVKTQRLGALRLALNGDVSKQSNRSEMFAFMPNRCLKCGAEGPGMMMTADHIIPQSKNKSLVLQVVNLQPLCGPCNNDKADKENIDYRTPEMKFAVLQRLLLRTGNIVPEKMSDRDINICTLRILQYTQQEIASRMLVSQSTVSKVLSAYVPFHNNSVSELLRVKKMIKTPYV